METKTEKPQFELVANKIQNTATEKTVAVWDGLVVRIVDPDFESHKKEFEKLCNPNNNKDDE